MKSLVKEAINSGWREPQKPKQPSIGKADNIFICKRPIAGQLYAHIRLLVMLHRAQKVILHGLFNPRFVHGFLRNAIGLSGVAIFIGMKTPSLA
jgi:hypothetical protein